MHFYYEFGCILYENRSYFLQLYPLNILALFALQFNVLFLAISVQCLADISILGAVLTSIMSFNFFFKVQQLSHLIGPQFGRLSLSRLNRYYREHTEILVLLIHANRIYGNAFLAYLLASMPFNVHLVLMLSWFDTEQNRITHFYLWCIALNQFITIFGFHLLSTAFTKQIHRDSKRLFHIYVHGQLYSLHNRLKLANYISKFHIDKPYGITYGKYGLITFNTFFRVR